MSKTHLYRNMAALPSLPAMRAFDAAARLGSFRAASEELHVSPTAISHHIRGLENQLGLKLFERFGRDAVLTEDGKRLAGATAQAFGILGEAIRKLQRTSRKVVRLAAGPIFTARWLMPRISSFWEAHPDIELEVLPTHRPGALDPKTKNADIVISWERLADMPKTAPKLLELRPVAIASQDYIDRHGPIGAPGDLLNKPILHQRNHWGWLDWFAAMGVLPDAPLRGAIFEDANILLRGAAEGQGAVVGWLPLIDQDLREGRVRRLFDEEIPPTQGYFVEVRDGTETRRETQGVIDWLVSPSKVPKD